MYTQDAPNCGYVILWVSQCTLVCGFLVYPCCWCIIENKPPVSTVTLYWLMNWDIVCNGTVQWGKNPSQLACNKTHPWYYPESLGFTCNEWWNIVCLCGVCSLFTWCSVLSNVCLVYSIHATRHRRHSRVIDQNWLGSAWPQQVSFWLCPHFWLCTMQVRSREERFLSSHSWLQARNLNWLFKDFFSFCIKGNRIWSVLVWAS